jgi:hypothetical protein
MTREEYIELLLKEIAAWEEDANLERQKPASDQSYVDFCENAANKMRKVLKHFEENF